jgi:hypothetical protein
LKELTANYTPEEKESVVEYFMELTEGPIKEFFEKRELPKSGIKPDIEKRLRRYLQEGKIEYKDLINHIDRIIPYEKQHVILYKGTEDLVEFWKDEEKCNKIFKDNNLIDLIEARIPLILPEEFCLTSIQYKPEEKLVVSAVKRIDQWRRKSIYDEVKRLEDNKEVE